jgi:DNA polymerase-3 subunit beta
MRVTCLQENLGKGLAVVGRAVATRTTLPITQNVLISTDEGRLKLAATNLEIAISMWVGAQVEEDGAITVPARLLTEFVNSLPEDKIEIASSNDPLMLALECARFEAHINGASHDDFPPIPSVESGVAIKVDPKILTEAIEHVAFAAATEDSRPVLTGIKVEIEGDGFTFAAADGFRLAVYNGKLLEKASEDVNFTIPAKALQEVARIAAGRESDVEFTVTPSKSQVLFRLEDVEIVSQLLQGTFPNYSQLIPQSFGTRGVVDLREFLRATRAASIFARDGSGIIRVQMNAGENDGPGRLSVSSRADEVGDNQGDVDADVEGDESMIAFNSKYLSEVLDVLRDGKVALEITSSSSPGVLRPVGTDGYVHVVMPMFVQW